MTDNNKRNLLYFEGDSMKELYETLDKWQQNSNKRLLSTSIQHDNGKFCCIALSNPAEMVICNGAGNEQAKVFRGKLSVEGYSL